MKSLFFTIVILLLFNFCFAQKVYQIRADSVRIYNVCDTAELILENRTQNINGFLYNKGAGRTEFQRLKLQAVGPSRIAILEQDTLDLSTLSGIGSSSLQDVTTVGNKTLNEVLIAGNASSSTNKGLHLSFDTVTNSSKITNIDVSGNPNTTLINMDLHNLEFFTQTGYRVLGLNDQQSAGLAGANFNCRVRGESALLNNEFPVLGQMIDSINAHTGMITLYSDNGTITSDRWVDGGYHNLSFYNNETVTIGTNFGAYFSLTSPGYIAPDEAAMMSAAGSSGFKTQGSDSTQIINNSSAYGLTLRGGLMKYWRMDPISSDNRLNRFTVDTSGNVSGSTMTLSSAVPRLELNNTNSALNAKRWRFEAGTNNLNIGALSDVGIVSDGIILNRTEGTLNSIAFVTNGNNRLTISPSGAVAFNASTGTAGQLLQTQGISGTPTWVNPNARAYTPTSTSDAKGSVGDITYDDNYYYIKTSTGWKRAALSTF